MHYYSADIATARVWAETAIKFAHTSGHRTTRRSAYVNLGNIEFAQGHLDHAEECFKLSLQYCERNSMYEVAILDNLAQVQLQLGKLQECREIFANLENIANQNADANGTLYTIWALQTKIRLLLSEGNSAEAGTISSHLADLACKLPRARVSAITNLLRAETCLANRESEAGTESLAAVFSPATQLPPDVFAEMERVTGKALNAAGIPCLARVHLERSVRMFEAIGHVLGKRRAIAELSPCSTVPTETDNTVATQTSLDRFRVLLDTRSRPELFGQEAIAVLRDLKCTLSIDLTMETDGTLCSLYHLGALSNVAEEVSIVLSTGTSRLLTLSFVPLRDAASRLTALGFRRVVQQILDMNSAEPSFSDQEVIWSGNEDVSTTPGVVFASNAMVTILGTIRRIASTDMSVLITGETGTGKEVIARTIHEQSPRSAMPFLSS